jgi:ribose 5-phosphate isomerase B
MTIYIGADHRGFETKERLKPFIQELGFEVVDMGNTAYDEGDDYPVFASKVAHEVSKNPNTKGVILCGSGGGVNIVANKFPGVRSNLGLSPLQVYAARRDDDSNVLCIAASFMTEDQEKESVKTFLTTEFSGEERHKRRLGEIAELEKQNFNPGI